MKCSATHFFNKYSLKPSNIQTDNKDDVLKYFDSHTVFKDSPFKTFCLTLYYLNLFYLKLSVTLIDNKGLSVETFKLPHS